MDEPSVYRGGYQRKYISPQEIRKMKENMKKVPIIQLKSEIYHKKEEQDAEKILSKLNTNRK